MDKLYVIYENEKMVETYSNGYNTKKGAKTVITQMAKEDMKKDGYYLGKIADISQHEASRLEKEKEKYEIRTFVNPKEINFWDYIKRKC